MLRYVPSIPAFWRVFFFYHKLTLNFVKGFLCIYWDNHFFSNLLMWCITLIDLQILKNPCIPGMNPTRSVVYELFNVVLNTICQCFVEDFCIYVHQWYWPVVFFCVCYLSLVLVSGQWEPYKMRKFSFLSNFLEQFQKDRF